MPRVNRRSLLLGAGSALCMPYVARAQSIALKVSLSAPYDGSTSPFFLGIQRGYYSEVGLTCQFDTSGGAVESIGRVGSAAYDFAVGDINVLMDFDAKNPDKAPSGVYMLYYRSPLCAISFAKSGISKPADLAGKTLGAAVTDGAYRLFPAFAKQNGIDPAGVKWKFVDLRLRESLLLRNDVDAILGFDSTSYFNLVKAGARGADIKFVYYSDFGLPLYSNGLIAAKKMLDNPDVTKRFLAASGRAWQAAMADPAAAITALQQKESLTDVALETERLKWVITNQLTTAESRANGLGAVDPARLASSIAVVKDGFDLPVAPPAEIVFNPAFLPSLDIRKIPG